MNAVINFLVGYAPEIIALLCVATIVTVKVKNYVTLTRSEQIEALREWLLYAVILAERDLGKGTGKLKLRSVYDMFLIRFPWLAKVLSFTEFNAYVDETVLRMKEMLANNINVVSFVDAKESGEAGTKGE